jgi:6-phosphogluconolactonase
MTPSDEARRRLRALKVLAMLGAAGIALAVIFQRAIQPSMLPWIEADPAARSRAVILLIAVLTSGPLLAAAWYAWRQGRQETRRRAAWRVLVTVPVLAAVVFLAILWRFAIVMDSAALRAQRLLFVGTYTGGTTGSEGIYAFAFDDATGGLKPRGLAAATPSPSFLAFSPERDVLFAVNELDAFGGVPSGSVTAFRVNRGGARLSAINTQPSRGAHPCHLELDQTGQFLAVANYTGGNYALFPVQDDGRLQPAVAVVAGEGRGPTARQEGPHGHAVTFDAANRFLIATDLGLDRVLVYRFDAKAGTLTPNAPPSVALAPGAGPRHFAFHPNGWQAFVINELDSTIASLKWDGSTGTFSIIGTVSTLPAGAPPNTTAEVQVHPSGRFVYGSNRGHDSIAVFGVAPDGSLKFVETESTRGRTPRNFTVDPTGRWLLAANQESSSIAVFSIDASTGALTPVGEPVSTPTPVHQLFVN